MLRLIPAHAGSTPWQSGSRAKHPAHPRSRGEHRSGKTVISLIAGSSPLTRGAPPTGPTPQTRRGLIPAHAGSTTSNNIHQTMSGAHPRSRGEHTIRPFKMAGNPGSSPLTRGARSSRSFCIPLPGLIPAHAGSTFFQEFLHSPARAHPRSRGEHPGFHGINSDPQGSSPLTRGAQVQVVDVLIIYRLIPAHAGSTPSSRSRSSSLSAHPRSRGEHSLVLFCLRHADGSSPLTRGARWCRWRAR